MQKFYEPRKDGEMDHKTSPTRPTATGASGGRQACCGLLNNRMRFLICIMGVLAITFSQMARGVLQLRITDMVREKEINGNTSVIGTDVCPWPDEDEGPTTTTTTTIRPDINDLEDGERFDWTTKQQTSLLGIFYYSYGAFMIPSGRLAEIYGAKYVLGASVAISGLVSLTTPLLARTNYYVLLFARILLGAAQAGIFPGAYALIGKWLTTSEAGIFAPLCKMSTRFGMALASCLPYIVADWPGAFYATGIICTLWTILWVFIATSLPEVNVCVSERELTRINRKKQKTLQQQEAIKLDVMSSNGLPRDEINDLQIDQQMLASQATRRKATPWLRILTSSSVIGFVMVKLAINYSSDFIGVLLNMYLFNVYHSSSETNGTVNLIFYSVYVAVMVPVGWFANYLIKSEKIPLGKTHVRIIFQSICCFGTTLCFGLIMMRNCDLLYTSVVLVVFSFLSAFSGGAETMLPYDLSEEYPATIMAIGNSVASISAPSLTALTGWVLGEETHSIRRWNVILLLVAAVNTIAGTFFALYVKAEPLDLDQKSGSSISEEPIDLESVGAELALPAKAPMKLAPILASIKQNLDKIDELKGEAATALRKPNEQT